MGNMCSAIMLNSRSYDMALIEPVMDQSRRSFTLDVARGSITSSSSVYNLVVLNRWIACEFTSFSTVFQSYQDDGRMIVDD